MTLSILGLGTALPEHSLSRTEAIELAQRVVCRTARQTRISRVLHERSGVEQRYTSVPYQIAYDYLPPQPAAQEDCRRGNAGNGAGNGIRNGNGHGEPAAPPTELTTTRGPTTAERMQWYAQHAPPLAVGASRRALVRADVAASDVTHLVTVSCTGFAAPGADLELIRELGLPPTVERVNVGFMGCHGAINGLRVSRGLVEGDPSAVVLLCAVELCSLHYRFHWDAERLVGNAIFGDGAAALVGRWSEATDSPSRSTANGRSASAAPRVTATGSYLLPETAPDIRWLVGDHGFEMTLSARVPDLIVDHLRPWLAAWLARRGRDIETIGCWAIHPGGPRILAAARESLGLNEAAVRCSLDVLRECGNMSSPTVLFVVERLLAAGAALPCVLLAFGPGIMAEAALVE